ncbi:MAG: HD domain-containing protein [Chloroflexi bacterium]|nr:HD domain-containing protein [Chloroflexota bacterium]
MSQAANYLNEVGMLNRTPRSGFAFLGTGQQSVSEHIARMLHIAFLLARQTASKVDELRLLHLVLFHDLPEARTGDQNYVNHKYVRADLDKVLEEGAHEWPFGQEIAGYIREFEERVTPEAVLANDADQLELLASLKEQMDLGNPHVQDWIPPLLARLKTDVAQKLAQEILATPWDEWWFSDKEDPHWVHHGRGEAASVE